MDPDPAAARSLAAQVAAVLDLARAERSAATGAAAAWLDEVIAALELVAAEVADLASVQEVLQVAARHGSGPYSAADLAAFTGRDPDELRETLVGMIRDGLAAVQRSEP